MPASYRTPDAIGFYLQSLPAETRWRNESTLQSALRSRMYEPGHWVPRVSPTPLLMVVGLDDTLTPTDLALAAYEAALEPKALRLIPGGHFAPNDEQFELSSEAALDFFRAHLTT